MRILTGVLLASVAVPAFASDTPRYEAAPAWVVPAPAPQPGGTGASLLAVADSQTRIDNGNVWQYRELASRAISAESLARAGTVSLTWQPYHGDLIVHRIDILRGGQRIDLIKAGSRFNVIRREQGLERLEMDGVLTATLQVPDLRVGDVLDVAYSTSTKDPALAGGVQANAPALPQPVKIDFARTRFLWPQGTPIRWKGYLTGLNAKESQSGGWHELNIALPAPKQPDLPPDVPARYRPLPFVEVSSFADWRAVSAVFAPLYKTDGLIAAGSPLAREVAQIRSTESDPRRRAAAALKLVQDRVRYFANGMNGGNYVPQSPTKTWTDGSGDCKAKTLLLLAMLQELGITAEPVLANIGAGDIVTNRLPAPAAFNHIFVHAKLGSEDLWMDGTGRGSRLGDLGDVPPFRFVLPVSATGADLLTLPFKAPAQPTLIGTVDVDQTATLAMPAPFTATVQVRGAAADMLRSVTAQLDNEKLLAFAAVSVAGALGGPVVPVTQKFEFNPAEATAVITVTGLTQSGWKRQDHVYRLRPASGLTSFQLSADRARAAWRDLPVSTGNPGSTQLTTRYHLPDGGRGIILEGEGAVDLTIAGRHFNRRTTLDGGVVTVTETTANSGAELAAADLPATRARLSLTQGRVARLVTGPNFPAPYKQFQSAARAHKLDKLAAMLTARIAQKPDDAESYRVRAQFYETSGQRELALTDLDKAVSLDSTAATLMRRGALLRALGRKDKAAADFQAALDLDPSSRPAIGQLSALQVDLGKRSDALALIDQRIDAADEDRYQWLLVKAEVQSRAGDTTGALATVDQAAALKPANAQVLNSRCWTKGTLAVQLDTALPDCTRAIELSEDNSGPLDSRAMVYYRLGRFDEALADLNAALDRNPNAAGSLYLRAAVERKLGRGAAADSDAADARWIDPKIDEDYTRWKVRA